MSKKDVIKLITGFAIVGTAIGFLLAYLKNYRDFLAAVNANTDEYEEEPSDNSCDPELASFSDSKRSYISID